MCHASSCHPEEGGARREDLWALGDSHAPSGLRMTEGESPVGVLDIDSAEKGTFDDTDATWLELIAQII